MLKEELCDSYCSLRGSVEGHGGMDTSLGLVLRIEELYDL
jgi:hypothetical protein